MKIAYLLKKFPRLSETFILTEVLSQEALGNELVIFSRREPDEEPRHAELTQLRACVEVFPRASELDPWTELFGDEGSGLGQEEWITLGRLVRELRPLVGPRLQRLVPEALHLRRRAAAHGVEHLHVHFATESAVVAMIAHELGGPSYSITAHAKDIYRSTVRHDLLDRLVQRSRFTVTVCDANVRHMSGQVGEAAGRRVRRLYNGLSLENFEYRDSGRQPDHVLAVGRLVEKKGFDDLLEALSLLKRRGRALRTTLVGGGDQEAQLRALARELGLSDEELVMTGPLEQTRVRDYLTSATVFCLPCVVGEDGNRDALPTVLLEALASGLPCISTPISGIPEILDRGRAGRIVPERDPLALANALEDLLRDEVARAGLARRGRERVLQEFDARRSASTLAGWFHEGAKELV